MMKRFNLQDIRQFLVFHLLLVFPHFLFLFTFKFAFWTLGLLYILMPHLISGKQNDNQSKSTFYGDIGCFRSWQLLKKTKFLTLWKKTNTQRNRQTDTYFIFSAQLDNC